MSFASTIICWFRENGRELPWRETHDPYAIWVSEIIMQQTRIDQGRPYWERFMRRWATVDALAAASEDEVLRQWQGLGYYSRARNLHQAAQQVVNMGGFPRTYEAIRSLKGVGDYTAAAIGSIAFNLPVAVVDGNVYRVLSRHFGISTPINTAAGKKEFSDLAQSLLPTGEAAAFNQGMMDFGALQCTPAAPRCDLCPLIETCIALREGRVTQLPVKERKLKVKERHLVYVYIRYNGQTAIHRRTAGDIWQGLYEPLILEPEAEEYDLRDMLGALDNASSCPHDLLLITSNVKHVLTHQVLYADFWLWTADACPHLPDGYFWIREEDVDHYAVPRLVSKLFEKLNT